MQKDESEPCSHTTDKIKLLKVRLQTELIAST